MGTVVTALLSLCLLTIRHYRKVRQQHYDEYVTRKSPIRLPLESPRRERMETMMDLASTTRRPYVVVSITRRRKSALRRLVAAITRRWR